MSHHSILLRIASAIISLQGLSYVNSQIHPFYAPIPVNSNSAGSYPMSGGPPNFPYGGGNFGPNGGPQFHTLMPYGGGYGQGSSPYQGGGSISSLSSQYQGGGYPNGQFGQYGGYPFPGGHGQYGQGSSQYVQGPYGQSGLGQSQFGYRGGSSPFSPGSPFSSGNSPHGAFNGGGSTFPSRKYPGIRSNGFRARTHIRTTRSVIQQKRVYRQASPPPAVPVPIHAEDDAVEGYSPEFSISLPLMTFAVPEPEALDEAEYDDDRSGEQEHKMARRAAKAPKVAKPKAPKAPKVAKPKVPSSHPAYGDMTKKAITELKEHKGSSRAAILKYILQHYKVGDNIVKINAHLRQALKRGVVTGSLKQTKGTGASGSFRIGDKPGSAAPKKAVGAKKAAGPKKAGGAKKSAVKKGRKPAGGRKVAAAAAAPAAAPAAPAPAAAPAAPAAAPAKKAAGRKGAPKKAGKAAGSPKKAKAAVVAKKAGAVKKSPKKAAGAKKAVGGRKAAAAKK
ncbi:linker histone h1 and h5 family domain-containing protein [Ditylenchus destructor]|uniref:Linker histone h1 and h5 family domain-containing protein n=1 Tax=Ditylenchus destructor TaxID=166010 RepID=A0AAD4MZA1_9BILA|nr:linker histone h1 and h5 family domain-containing protein [Ditylenchus destructor]